MKRYKLTKDLPTFNKGDTFQLDEDLGCLVREKDRGVAYGPYALEKFNILDSGWFEEIPEECERWRAKKGKRYWWVQNDGWVADDCEIRADVDDGRYELGNYFKTEEEAEKATNWLKTFAILRDDTKGFKPDWEDSNQNKWYVLYDHAGKELDYNYARVFQTEFLYFATREDAEASIKNHKQEWLAFIGVEE